MPGQIENRMCGKQNKDKDFDLSYILCICSEFIHEAFGTSPCVQYFDFSWSVKNTREAFMRSRY